MKNFSLMLFASLFSFAPLSFAEKKEEFKMIHVADLQKTMNEKKTEIHIFDANTPETRKKEGLIPGAKQLESVTKYDAKTVLPSNKSAFLVFYCANTTCTASHEAAKVAVKAGYTNVSVMSEGIKGWKEAGGKIEQTN